jgi:hypothetical protein
VAVPVTMLSTSVPKDVTIVDIAGYGTSCKDQNSSIKFGSLDTVLNTKKEDNSPTMASNKYTSSSVLCWMANTIATPLCIKLIFHQSQEQI